MSAVGSALTASALSAAISSALPARPRDNGMPMTALWSQGEQGAWYDPSDFERYMSGRGPEAAPTNYATAALAVGGVLGAGITRAADYIDFNAVGTGQSAPLAAVTPIRNGGWYEMTFTVSNFVVGAVRIIVYGTASFLLTGNAAANGTYTVVLKNDTAGGSLNQCINVQTNATSTTLRVSGVSVRELTNVNTATLFQDAAGTTPVTAMEQPVGLMLDKRLGLVRGPELVTNGACTGTTGWTAPIGTLSNPSGATIRVDTIGGAEASLRNGFAVTAGKSYEVTFDLISANNAGAVSVGGHRVIIPGPAQNSGPKRLVLTATVTTNSGVEFSTNTPTAGYHIEVDNVSVREIPGNHASQATTTARPLLSARKNLLLSTEDLRSGGWGIGSGAVITGAKTFSIAATSDSRLQFPAVNCQQGATYSASATLSGTGTVRLEIVDSGGAYMRSAVEIVLTATPTRYNVSRTLGDAAATGMNFRVTGTGTAATVTIDQPQYETGPTATRYQRVNTATDYDWVGFPMYLKFDGVDDHFNIPHIDVPAAYSALFAVAVDGGVGAYRALWSQRTSTPSSGDIVYAAIENVWQTWVGNGTNFSMGIGSPVVIGELCVVEARRVGTTGYSRKNLLAEATIFAGAYTPSAKAGRLMAGGDADAAMNFQFNGRMYAAMIVASNASAVSRDAVRRAFANKAGVTLQ